MNKIEDLLKKAFPGSGQVLKTIPPESAANSGDEPVFQPNNPCIVAYGPDSPIAEDYRKLKTTLLKMTREDFRNTLVVTSGLSGEGKSVTSCNLAIMLARDYGQTVLLIDADLRGPSLHEYLGIENKFGIADCLEDRLDAGQAIVRTGIPKLSFMPAGKDAADPSELLSSARMKEFLAELKYRYRDRYIIIDTPPALLFAETQALSALVDGILLVVKEGVATQKSLGNLLTTLKDSPLLGIVYNDASAVNFDRKYRHYYQTYYRNKSGKRHYR